MSQQTGLHDAVIEDNNTALRRSPGVGAIAGLAVIVLSSVAAMFGVMPGGMTGTGVAGLAGAGLP